MQELILGVLQAIGEPVCISGDGQYDCFVKNKLSIIPSNRYNFLEILLVNN